MEDTRRQVCLVLPRAGRTPRRGFHSVSNLCYSSALHRDGCRQRNPPVGYHKNRDSARLKVVFRAPARIFRVPERWLRTRGCAGRRYCLGLVTEGSGLGEYRNLLAIIILPHGRGTAGCRRVPLI